MPGIMAIPLGNATAWTRRWKSKAKMLQTQMSRELSCNLGLVTRIYAMQRHKASDNVVPTSFYPTIAYPR